MTEQVKVGLVGCGAIAGRHVGWFLAKPECEISALCDVSTDAMAGCAQAVRDLRPDANICLTGDHRELVSLPDLDAIAVLLPHNLHYGVGMAALEAGKHVLIEKPMVTSSAHARALVQTAAKQGKLIGVGYQRSYISEYQYVRRMVESGELGEIRFVSAHLEQGWYEYFCGPKSGDSWRKRAGEAGGGQLVDTGSHTVAAMLDVTKLVPQEAFAFIDRRDLSIDVNTAAVVRFTSGAVGTLCIGGYGHSVTEVLRVVGEKRSARIFFRTVHEQSLEVDGEVIDAKSEIPASSPNADFIDAILGKTRIQSDGMLGLRVAQLSDALYCSAAENRPVVISMV
jgi:predicted dehydrogenase